MILASALAAGGFIWWVFALITAVFPARRAAAWRLLLAVGFAFLVNDYVLIRGTTLYHILFSGRLSDRENIEAIGEQIARSFRVKE